MKTVIIWNDTADSLKFCVVEGDKSHLDDVYINEHLESQDYRLHDELSDLIYTPAGKYKNTMLDKFPTAEVRAGAIVITAGFYA